MLIYLHKQHDEDNFHGHDDKVILSRLHSLEVLWKTFYFIKPHVTRRSHLLNKFQEFIMVVIKLCLIVSHQDMTLL